MSTNKNHKIVVFFFSILLFLSSNTHAKTDIGIKAGSLGAGVDITHSLSPYVSTRFIFNNFSYEYDGVREGISFQVPITIRSYGSQVDFHPFKGIFRISTGLYINRNTIALTASGDEIINLGDTDYQGEFKINGEMLFRKMAPYIGVGWSPSPTSKSKWGFSADIGVMFHGTPKLQADASGRAVNTETNVVIENVLSSSEFLDDLNTEIDKYQKEIDDFSLSRFYPVVSFGFILQF